MHTRQSFRTAGQLLTKEFDALNAEHFSENLTLVSETQPPQIENVRDVQSEEKISILWADDYDDGTANIMTTTNNWVDGMQPNGDTPDANTGNSSQYEADSSNFVDFARSAVDIFEDLALSGCEIAVKLGVVSTSCVDESDHGILSSTTANKSANKIQAMGNKLEDSSGSLPQSEMASSDDVNFARSKLYIFEDSVPSCGRATTNLGAGDVVVGTVKADGEQKVGPGDSVVLNP